MAVYVWLMVLIFFVIIEGITVGLITIWFAGGALAAALAAYLGAGVIAQLLIFISVSVVLLIFTRPLAVKYIQKNKTETNVNSLIGRSAVVTRTIDNLAETGQVRISDVEWTARSADEGTIPENAVVEITAVEGVKLIVKERKEKP